MADSMRLASDLADVIKHLDPETTDSGVFSRIRQAADFLAATPVRTTELERRAGELNFAWTSILEAVQKAVGDRWNSATGTNHDRVLHFIAQLGMYGSLQAEFDEARQRDLNSGRQRPVIEFLTEVRGEIERARAKFPHSRLTTIALGEEAGELCKAILDEPAKRVRAEAVQLACMAARVVLDGDRSVDEHRAQRGLDAIGGGAA